jgi:hypothetical protein
MQECGANWVKNLKLSTNREIEIPPKSQNNRNQNRQEKNYFIINKINEKK